MLLSGVLLVVAGVVSLPDAVERSPPCLVVLAVRHGIRGDLAVGAVAWSPTAGETILAWDDQAIISAEAHLFREGGAFYDAGRHWLTATTDRRVPGAVRIVRNVRVTRSSRMCCPRTRRLPVRRPDSTREGPSGLALPPGDAARRLSRTGACLSARNAPHPEPTEADEQGVNRLARLALYAGTAVCVAGLSKAHAVVNVYSWSGSSRFAWSLAYVVLLAVTAYAFGLPDQPRTRRAALATAIGTTATAAGSISVLQLFAGDALLPRFVVLGSAVILVPWYVLCSYLARDASTRATERDRVMVVAEEGEVAILMVELERAPERAATIVGALTTAGATSTSMPPSRPMLEMTRALGATVIVLGRAAQVDDDIVTQASMLHEEGVRVRTMSLFYEQWLGKLPIGELERVSLLFDIGELHAAGYARVKRLLDLALATVGLLALAAVTPFVLVGDLIANRGPLMFRQPRTGRGGVPFEILKFRTMRSTADDDASDWTAADDARVTRFGHFLRRTHLDELPQVVNVLRGELSVVGPRPEQPQLVSELVDKLPFYRLRHLVRPGLTGWAQVKFPYAGNEAETLEKLQYEFYYLRRQSLGLDLRIVSRTLRTVIGGQGR